MPQVFTNLVTRESARKQRFEPTGKITQTNVQKAIEQVAAGAPAVIGTARLPPAAANVAILAADIEVGIDSAAGVTATPLPSVAAFVAANPNGLELTVFDLTGHAGANNITPSLNGTDVFTQGAVPVIRGNFGDFKLRPVIVPGGPNQWFVRGQG